MIQANPESGTLVLLLAKIIYDLIRDRRTASGKPCPPGEDCYYPTDRERDNKVHANVVKLCQKNGVDPDV